MSKDAEQTLERVIAATERGDYEAAIDAIRPLLEAGNAEAQYFMGCLCQHGEGVEQDYEKALHLYRLAAAQGHAVACYALGYLYHFGGENFPCDHVQALEWYRKGAKLGDPNCPNQIGSIYEEDSGVPPDLDEAFRWYRRAAELGNPLGEGNLARAYLYGVGVEKDAAEAVLWCRKAALKDFAPAQIMMAELFEKGVGIEKDLAHAYAWVCLANESESSRQSQKLQKRIARKLTADQADEGEMLITALRVYIQVTGVMEP